MRQLSISIFAFLMLVATFVEFQAQSDAYARPVSGYKKVVRPLSSLWVETECDFDAQEREHSCSYLRFYSDGTVINATTTGNPNEIKRWFRRPYTSTGKYVIEGSTLRLSVTTENGKIDFEGVIVGDILTLNVHSHINGFRGVIKYKWIRPRSKNQTARRLR